MTIEPCIKEMREDWLAWIVYILLEIYGLSLCDWSVAMLLPMILLTGIALFFTVRRQIYLGRTIILTPENCTFSILGYQKTYEWKELNVQFCENKWVCKPGFILDVYGPGIMICEKTLEIQKGEGGPSYCRTRHPIHSVFIRFQSEEDDYKNAWNGIKNFTYGYSIEQNAIIGYLKSIGVY